jgi:hypothetical protein
LRFDDPIEGDALSKLHVRNTRLTREAGPRMW